MQSKAGAKRTMSIMYFNARSLMPKLDELCVFVVSSNIILTLFASSKHSYVMSSRTMRLPFRAMNVHRLDRLNRHGGGIVMYTSENFVANVIPDLSPDLEFLPVSIRLSNCKVCICTFYRPPSSASSIFDTFFSHWVL